MLNAEGDENGIKINRSNWQKKKKQNETNCTCSTLFFLIQSKNQIFTCSTLFVFLCRCFAPLQRCFVGLNRQPP